MRILPLVILLNTSLLFGYQSNVLMQRTEDGSGAFVFNESSGELLKGEEVVNRLERTENTLCVDYPSLKIQYKDGYPVKIEEDGELVRLFYDSEGRLSRIVTPSSVVLYTYGSDGALVSVHESDMVQFHTPDEFLIQKGDSLFKYRLQGFFYVDSTSDTSQVSMDDKGRLVRDDGVVRQVFDRDGNLVETERLDTGVKREVFYRDAVPVRSVERAGNRVTESFYENGESVIRYLTGGVIEKEVRGQVETVYSSGVPYARIYPDGRVEYL